MNNFISVEAKIENWNIVYNFLSNWMISNHLKGNIVSQIFVACEEVFVNISKYAYPNSVGTLEVNIYYNVNDRQIEISITDFGVKFDPTKINDPIITKSIQKRKFGGLGIFLTKKMVDDIKYNYIDNRNCLTLIKKLK